MRAHSSSGNGSSAAQSSAEELRDFSPKGAIAFFFLMIVMFTLMWFSLYFELLNRI